MNELHSFDVIVIGVGSMGASACFFLAQRGQKVLGIEQFEIPNKLGSHSGQSRIFRKAYFEHPDYVPLLNKAYENWIDLEKQTGEEIFFRTGLVYIAQPDHELLKGVKRSAALYDIPLENIDNAAAVERFSQFHIPGNREIVYEPDAGFVTPEKAVKLYTTLAIQKGAKINTLEKVLDWKREKSGFTVTTNINSYQCGKLIITAGAWAGKLIPAVVDNIKVTRQVVAWVKTKNERAFAFGNFPCWMIAEENEPGVYYGFPSLPVEKFGNPAGLKLAYHYPGEKTDPDNVNRETSENEIKNLENILRKYLPGAFESVLSIQACLYANTADENFIIDKLPGYEEHGAIACGFSGHGFKFVSVVGEILADLVINGKTNLPIDFLNAHRFLEET